MGLLIIVTNFIGLFFQTMKMLKYQQYESKEVQVFKQQNKYIYIKKNSFLLQFYCEKLYVYVYVCMHVSSCDCAGGTVTDTFFFLCDVNYTVPCFYSDLFLELK